MVEIIKLGKEIIPEQIINPSITHDDMITNLKAGNIYDGFLGGIETTKLKAESMVYEIVNFEEDEETEIKYLDLFPSYESLDGKKIAIRICKPLSKVSWKKSNSEIFTKFVEDFGTTEFTAFKTKSDFDGLVNSSIYVEETLEE